MDGLNACFMCIYFSFHVDFLASFFVRIPPALKVDAWIALFYIPAATKICIENIPSCHDFFRVAD